MSFEPKVNPEVQCCLDICVELEKHIEKLRKDCPCIEYTTAYYQLEAVYRNLKRKGVRHEN